MSNIIHLNESELKNQLGELVRGTVEETLNKLLDAEADKITNACRYERSSERLDTRAVVQKKLCKPPLSGKIKLTMEVLLWQGREKASCDK
jgi:putative transposase